MTEIFSTLGKSDINEEVVRFNSHLGLVAKLIKSKNNIGKIRFLYAGNAS